MVRPEATNGLPAARASMAAPSSPTDRPPGSTYPAQGGAPSSIDSPMTSTSTPSTMSPSAATAPAYVPPGGPPPAGSSAGGVPERRRPPGVTVLAVLAGLVAFLALIGAAAAFVGGAMLGVEGGSAETSVGSGAVLAMGVFLLVYGLFAAAVAFGLFRGIRWAWYAALVLAGLGILNGLIMLTGGDILGAVLAFILNGLVLWYLMRPDVRGFFGVRERSRGPRSSRAA